MILTCPQCATRYQIENSKFPPEGRKVRCAKCGHGWFQAAPAPELESVPVSVPAAGSTSSSQPTQARPDAGRSAPEMPEERTRRGPPGERTAVIVGWIGLAAVLGLIVWGAIRYRDAIAEVWPQTASLYAALGLPANAHGLAFESVSYQRKAEAGQPVLVVNGTVINASAREVAVPRIQVVLTDDARHSVDRWTFLPPRPHLAPGARMTF